MRCGEIFLFGEAPSRHKERGERNGEEHAEYATESGAPKENRDDNGDGVKTSTFAHHFRGDDPTLDELDDGFHEQDESQQWPAAAGLEKCQRHDRREADDRAEVGDDVEGAEDKSDEETKFQADEREADREEHAEDEADEHLTAKKGFDDDDEFADEKHDIGAHVRAQEGQVIAELSGGLASGEEKEKQINRHDGQVSEEGEDAEGTAAGGLERGDREGSDARELGAE